MLARQRHAAILELLEEAGAVKTVDLAAHFSVTDETIRRDLYHLDAKGLLTRTHGGALLAAKGGVELSLRERKVHHLAQKRKIARMALSTIKTGSIVFFDASSSVLELARLLPDEQIKVVTNSLAVIEVLAQREKIEVISTGGAYLRVSHSFGGSQAILGASRFSYDGFYFSGTGVDLQAGISEISEDQALLKEALLSRSKVNCLLADASKVGLRSPFIFASFAQLGFWFCEQDSRQWWKG